MELQVPKAALRTSMLRKKWIWILAQKEISKQDFHLRNRAKANARIEIALVSVKAGVDAVNMF
ncbi:hypothetical protein EO98_07555 [Methanosarcina sp. 2.H.T.1A.6]|nr:hypothetical protein EO94_07485 [Methanosarcina sp. 2.H.T.1A.3]KKG20957.1 hypothetical protein EO98_07555 [Methanosarcina sp. 2.H.T.1A.6]KKG22952.1 hypothetical protein EO96_08770 [Methanosarcina sp. 2.H.T.1A.8]KKG25011.1 hypothetical protein EO97_19505 [Methanosarcina sp. 2.H.T.1A.15]